jgi:hypothetical protein
MEGLFVVSQDLEQLLGDWCNRHGFRLIRGELDKYRRQISAVLKDVFPELELIDEGSLRSGLADLAANYHLPIISLDGVYLNSRWRLGLTRQVSYDGENLGLGPRFGWKSQPEQMRQLATSLLGSGHDEVVIADDVIFAGDLMSTIIQELAEQGIAVRAALAGVSIGQGADRLRNLGVTVQAVRDYDQVIDEVCERDFLPGAPFSGRTIAPHGAVDAGLPYLQPFGHPIEWASVPAESAGEFSASCLEAAIELYRAIGQRSEREVRMRDLDRWPGQPTVERGDEPVDDFLRKCLESNIMPLEA